MQIFKNVVILPMLRQIITPKVESIPFPCSSSRNSSVRDKLSRRLNGVVYRGGAASTDRAWIHSIRLSHGSIPSSNSAFQLVQGILKRVCEGVYYLSSNLISLILTSYSVFSPLMVRVISVPQGIPGDHRNLILERGRGVLRVCEWV